MRKTGLLIYNRKRYRIVKEWFINRNTPVGEPADWYESKPFGGKMFIEHPVAYLYEDGKTYEMLCHSWREFHPEYIEAVNKLGYNIAHEYSR